MSSNGCVRIRAIAVQFARSLLGACLGAVPLPHAVDLHLKRALAAILIAGTAGVMAEPMAWMSDGLKLYQAQIINPQIVRTLSLPVMRLAADSTGGVWVTTGSDIRRIDVNGATATTVTLASIGLADTSANAPFSGPVQLTADPSDGSVWALRTRTTPVGSQYESRMVHLGSSGQVLLNSALLGTPSIALAVGLDHKVWALSSQSLKEISTTGAVSTQVTLPVTAMSTDATLGLDPLGQTIFYGNFSIANGAFSRIALNVTPSFPSSGYGEEFIQEMAIDPFREVIWAIGDTSLNRLQFGGTIDRRAFFCLPNFEAHPIRGWTDICVPNDPPPPPQARGDDSLAAGGGGLGFYDCEASVMGHKIGIVPATGAVWVGHCRGVNVYSSDGQFLLNIPTSGQVQELSITPFSVTPQLTLLSPPAQTTTRDAKPLFTLAYGAACPGVNCTVPLAKLGAYQLNARLDNNPLVFTLNSSTQQATYTPATSLTDGLHQFTASVTNAFGQVSNTVSSAITVDTVAPQLIALTPPNDSRVLQSAITLTGQIDEAGGLLLGAAAAQGPNFSFPISLQPGTNALQLTATDLAANSRQIGLNYHYLTVSISAPIGGAMINADQVTVSGAYTGPADTVVSVNSVSATLANGTFSANVPLAVGSNLLVVNVTSAGITATQSITVTRDAGGGGVGAPPLDTTMPTTVANATAFLYTGPNPIQTGVAPGTIDLKRVSVVRGKVLERSGTPLAGVQVTIHKSTQYGQTLSRADGMFDMAVNGGGPLTIKYSKTGYLPVTRLANMPWGDYVVIDDVVLTPLDPIVTIVNLGAGQGMQVASGSPSTDQDGTRRATVMFPQGTTASLILANGQQEALTSLKVRATEFTVGPNGGKAMPAQLEPTTAYTYAVELSVDEAIDRGAKEVRFSNAIPVYVENFLNFPVGGIVPSGYYDPDKAAWIPSPNGKVIKLLSVSNGLAALDLTGNGQAASGVALAALGVTDAERASLAAGYPIGQTLWRVPVTHFTPYDFNWAVRPSVPAPAPPAPPPPGPEDQSCKKPGGSSIECQNQTLLEEIGIVGTPVTLHYSSGRVPGRDAAPIVIPLTGASIPASVTAVHLVVQIAGQRFERSFAPAPNLSHEFAWNGLDAYGRVVSGAVQMTIRVGYTQNAPYAIPRDVDPSFGLPPSDSASLTISPSREQVTRWTQYESAFGNLPAMKGVGGWSIAQHHAYDPTMKRAYMGKGDRRSANTVAGAMIAEAFVPPVATHSVSAAPNGDFYFTSFVDNRLYKKAKGAGLASVEVPETIGGFGRIQVDGSGLVYIADLGAGKIVRFDPITQTTTTLAGCGADCQSPYIEGGFATSIGFNNLKALALDDFGNVYFAARVNADYSQFGMIVYKVNTAGRISRYAGKPYAAAEGDGGAATEARLGSWCNALAMDKGGALYILCSDKIRRVTPAGVISTVAGGGVERFLEGVHALEAKLNNPIDIAIDGSGGLFIAESGEEFYDEYDEPSYYGLRIRHLKSDGVINTIVGSGKYGVGQPPLVGQLARAAAIASPRGFTVSPAGELYIGLASLDGGDPVGNILVSGDLMLGITNNNGLVNFVSGDEHYVFDEHRRHLRTYSTRTAALLYEFGYSNGLLTSITDGDNNVTLIERDTAGVAQAIVAPFGRRTTLGYDSNGWLNEVADPMAQTHRMEYTRLGLMTRFVDPKGHASTMQYVNGRLVRDEMADVGSWDLVRTEQARGYTVRMTSAEGRSTSYQIERQINGDERRVETSPDEVNTISLIRSTGVNTFSSADGSVTTVTQTGDPRFGMRAPLSSTSTKQPSGLTRVSTTERTVALATVSDPFSMTQETTTVKLNGRTFLSNYVAASRQTTSTSPANRSVVTRTDGAGRPVFAQLAGMDAVTYLYDSNGRPKTVTQGTGADQRTLDYTYGTDGFVLRVTDALTQEVVYERDDVGRIKKATLPGARVMESSYDANGNTKTFTPPGTAAHSFDYSTVDLETFYTAPAVPGVTDLATEYVYNRDKDITQINWPGSVSAVFSYAAAGGKLSAITPSAGAGAAISYAYLPATGQLSTLSTTDATLTFGYDGSLPKQEARTGTLPASLERVFDNDFRVTSLKLNGTAVASFDYDADSLLKQSGAMTITRHPSHGLISGTALGALTTTQTYSGFGELKTFEAKQGATSLLSYQLGYDKLGRVVIKTETVTGVTSSYEYGYDPAGRLATVKLNGVQTSSYGFDGNGNRTHVNGVLNASFDPQDRLVTRGAVGYTYTARGTLKDSTQGGQTTSYDYDAFGNLRSVVFPGGGRVDYVMDGLQRRIGRKVNGTLVQGFVYQDGLRVIAELDGAGQVLTRFVHGEKPNVPEYMVKAGITYRLITDHLGSVRLVVNAANGQIAQRIDYDEWGRVTSDSSPGFQPFGFAGGLYDTATKLVRFGARDYDAEAGRWTAKDSIRFAGGDSNLYAYAGGDPTSKIDPYGFFCVNANVKNALSGAIGAGVTAIIATKSPMIAVAMAIAGGIAGYQAGEAGGGAITGAISAGFTGPRGFSPVSAAVGFAIGALVGADGTGIAGAAGGVLEGTINANRGATVRNANSYYGSGFGQAVKGMLSGGLGGLASELTGKMIDEINKAYGDCSCGNK